MRGGGRGPHLLGTPSMAGPVNQAELVLQVGDLSLSAASRRVLHRGWAAVAQVQLKEPSASLTQNVGGLQVSL